MSKGKSSTRAGGIAAASAQRRSLCERCLWDCVQPYGITVACPYYADRAPEQERQVRSGQMSFGFGAAGGKRAEAK